MYVSIDITMETEFSPQFFPPKKKVHGTKLAKTV